MASSGSIWVSLGLTTANFSKGIKQAKGQLNGFQKATAGLKGMFNPFTIGLGAVAAVGGAFVDAADRVKSFDKSMKTLSAITGATGDELDLLKDKAIEMGSKTTLSAGQVADGFKLIASAKPELLESGEALASVTDSAITLAEAAGITMEEASGALANTLNQFGASAAEASKFVDVLAAGSQKGAGDVNFLNEAFVKAGVVASQAGLSVTETAASFEVLAEKGFKAEAAGTQFRNILIKLQGGADDTNPAIVGLDKAIENLGKQNLSATELTKMFGSQNLAAAQTLLTEQERLSELTIALDENGIALKQQATNNDTLEGSLKQLDSAWEGLILTVEDGDGVFSKVFKGITDGISSIISGVTDLLNFDFSRPEEGFNSYLKALTGVNFGLDATGEKIANLDNQLKVQNVTSSQLAARSGELAKQFVKTGMSASEAANHVKQLVETRKQLEGSTDNLITKENTATTSTRTLTKEIIKAGEEAAKTQAKIDEFARGLMAEDFAETGFGGDIFADADAEIAKIQEEFNESPVILPIRPEVEPIPDEQMEALAAQEANMLAVADGVGGGITNAFSNMANGMANSMDEADTASGRFLKSLGATVMKLIATNMASAMSNAITGATASGAATGPGAVVSTPAFIASAISGIIGAFAAIPKFADGGLVFNDMIGMIGEGKGTTRSNPEVIAPLDKLKSFMPSGDGGGMGGEVVFKIKRDELEGILKRGNKINKFSGV